MLIIWRDLLIGLLAWYCGDNAVHFFSRATPLHVDKVSHFFTLLMFEPWDLFLPAVFYFFASYLLYYLLKSNAGYLIKKSGLPASDRLLHLAVLAFALYLVAIQTVKMPLATGITAFAFGVFNLVQFLRSRALAAEINQLRKKQRYD